MVQFSTLYHLKSCVHQSRNRTILLRSRKLRKCDATCLAVSLGARGQVDAVRLHTPGTNLRDRADDGSVQICSSETA